MVVVIQRLISGLGLSGSIILVSLVGRVVSVPVLLTYWGTEMYGEWVVLTSLVASLSVLNLGVQSYAGNRMIACYVREETEEGARILHAALRLYLVLCSLALLVTLFLVLWPYTMQWLRINSMSTLHARVILAIQGGIATYAIFGGLLMGLFRVAKQYPRQLAYSLVERIILLGIPLWIAWLGGMPVHSSLMVALLLGVVSIIALRDVARRTPFSIGLSGASWDDALALVIPSISFFGVSVAATLLSTGMIVAISKTSGGLAVVVFTTTLMLTNLVRLVIQQGMNVLWPEITAVAARAGESNRLVQWHRLGLKLVCTMALLASTTIVLLGPDVLVAWTRGRVEIDAGLNQLLVLYLLIQAPALVSNVFGLATNHQKELLFLHFIVTGISLLITWFLLSSLGVLAAAIGLIVGQVVGTSWSFGLACHWTSDRWRGLMSDVLGRGFLPISVVSLVTYALSGGPVGLKERILGVFFVALLTLVVVWKLWFTKSQVNLFISKVNEGFQILRGMGKASV